MNSRTRKTLSIFAAISAAFVVSSCGGSGTFSPAIQGIGQPVQVTVTVNPQGQTVTTGGAQQFTATVTGTGNTAVQWAVSSSTDGNIGTITAGGLYTAPNSIPARGIARRPGTKQSPGDTSVQITITATSLADPSASGTAIVTLQQANVTVTVTPVNPTMDTGEEQQFTANVTGTSNTSVTWSLGSSVSGNIGTITSGGLYTAPQNLPSKGGGSKKTPGDTTVQINVLARSVAQPGAVGESTITLQEG